MRKKLFGIYTAMGLTDKGLVRAHNEDNILIDDTLGLLLVADGMGGHQAGEVASQEAIKIIQKMLSLQHRANKNESWFTRLLRYFNLNSLDVNKSIASIEKALYEANHHVYRLNLELNEINGSGMGTTVAGCQLISSDIMLVFHIGDSRIYKFSNQKLEMLSKDHSVLQEWFDQGCKGNRPHSNVILRAVGPYPESLPDVQVVAVKPNDNFLICSDGLTDMVNDKDIERTLQGLGTDHIVDYVHNLLDVALEHGGKDNVSIILLTQKP